jgi:dTDP-4-dehydrorhamnose 3,5-epimerase
VALSRLPPRRSAALASGGSAAPPAAGSAFQAASMRPRRSEGRGAFADIEFDDLGAQGYLKEGNGRDCGHGCGAHGFVLPMVTPGLRSAGMAMIVDRLEIPDLLLLTPTKRGDSRGFLSETFRGDIFAAHGINATFVQDNHAFSVTKGVVRGLHFQAPPHAQGKLIRCIRGAILDVGVDIRAGSPTYGRHIAVELSALNWHQLWIPPGFAHGYVTLQDDCEVTYKLTDYYAPECERGIAWDDPALGIDWRISPDGVILADKDRNNPRLIEAAPAFHFEQQGEP